MTDLKTRCKTPFGTIHLRLDQFTFFAKFPKGFIPRHLDGEAVLSPLEVLVAKRAENDSIHWYVAQISEPEMDCSAVYLDEESLAIVNSQYKIRLNLGLDYARELELEDRESN